jgi:HlyD family secretion protein
MNALEEARSEEVQEVMGHVPSRILQYGLFGIFTILFSVIMLLLVIKSKDVISTEINLTTESPPARIVSQVNSTIETILFKEGEHVEPGAVIATMTNPGPLATSTIYLMLTDYLKSESLEGLMLVQAGQLGELHLPFSAYLNARSQYQLALADKAFERKLSLQLEQIKIQEEQYSDMILQTEVRRMEFKFIERQFKSDSTHYFEKKYGISSQEYQEAFQRYLQDKIAFLATEASLKSGKGNILQSRQAYENTIAEIKNHDDQLRALLREQYDRFQKAVQDWSAKYIITSPIAGKVTFTNFWSSHQRVQPNDVIGTVVPSSTAFIGKAYIPYEAIGSVKIGQRVFIKLTGFPHLQFGQLIGKIRKISLVPETKGYAADIALADGMNSTYKNRLNFFQEMRGSCEIVVAEKPVLYKFFSPLEGLFKIAP